jgi:hypothetical protein
MSAARVTSSSSDGRFFFGFFFGCDFFAVADVSTCFDHDRPAHPHLHLLQNTSPLDGMQAVFAFGSPLS